MEHNSNNKQIILENAVQLFAAKGYDGVGVQEICNASNITKPTLYYYFSNKAGLLSAIIETKGENLFENLKNAAEYNHNFTDSLKKILKAEIEFAKNNPDFFMLHFSLSTASSTAEAALIHQPFAEKLENIFADFFCSSTAEIGNMRGKETIFSRIFHQICRSVALDILQQKLDYNEDILESVIKAFAFGVVNG